MSQEELVESKKRENKKEDKKFLGIFALIIFAAVIVGFVVGMFSNVIKENFAQVIAET